MAVTAGPFLKCPRHDCAVGLVRLEWRGLKVGLWTALCYPGADCKLSGLGLTANFLSLLVYEQEQDSAGDEKQVFDLYLTGSGHVAYKSPAWYICFHRSMRAYHDTRQCLLDCICIPDLEAGTCPDL
ncbi:uncharacterized protein EDB91DRAFT_1176102, partial [Suillus paluster]